MKILQFEDNKIFKVCLAFFNITHERVNPIIPSAHQIIIETFKYLFEDFQVACYDYFLDTSGYTISLKGFL